LRNIIAQASRKNYPFLEVIWLLLKNIWKPVINLAKDIGEFGLYSDVQLGGWRQSNPREVVWHIPVPATTRFDELEADAG